MLDVRLLGPVRLLRDGHEVALGGAKQRGVLALLALESPRAVSLDTLVEGVWGQSPPPSARNAVQVYVSGLRRALGDDDARIERTGDTYRLVGPRMRIDLGHFTEQVAEGRSALRSRAPARAADLLDAALRSWDGPTFGGLEGLPLHERATRLVEDARTTAQVELVDALLRVARPLDASTIARDLVTGHPLDEHGWVLLATAQYHSGQQGDALATCRRLRRLLAGELGVDPSAEVVATEQAILAHSLTAPWLDSAGTPGSAGSAGSAAEGGAAEGAPAGSGAPQALPRLPRPFVGRDRDVDRIASLLLGERLVTVTGFGGLGKTTVSVAVARRLRGAVPAVHFCDLQADTTPGAALDRVCRDLGLDPGDDPVVVLAGVQAGTLLVLDNAEQIERFGAAVSEVLDRTSVSLLVTSRHPLRVRQEQVVRLQPLSVETAGDGRPSPAATLFLAHAERVRSGASEGSLPAAEHLCALLDGIPLAIELAATRVRALTVEQLTDRLSRGPGALGTARRSDLPERQASLTVVLDASLELLGTGAALLVRELAGLGGWTSTELVEQIHAQVGATRPHGLDFVDDLEDVVDVGLAEVDGAGRVRLRAPVRDHVVAAEGHQDGHVSEGGPDGLHECIDRNVAELVHENARLLHGPDAAVGVRRLSHDHDPVLATLAHTIARGQAARAGSMVLDLGRYWLLSGRVVEGRRWIDAVRTLEHDLRAGIRLDLLSGTYGSYLNDPHAVRVLTDALAAAERESLDIDRLVVNGACCLAATTAHLGDLEAARRHAATAAGLAERSGDPTLVALARDLAGHVASYTGEPEVALEATLAGITDARRSGDRFDLVNLLCGAAENLMELGRGAEAVDVSAEAFELSRGLDVGPVVVHVLMMRGLALTQVEQVREARGCLIEALRISNEQYPDRLTVGGILTALAVAAASEGDDVGAARLWGSADAVFADEGAIPASRTGSWFRPRLAAVEDRLGAQSAATLRAVGAADPDHVVVRLLGQTGAPEAGRAIPRG
jgi:DNA-binding SARP family transcriptional activator/predicted ATPase